MSLLIAYIERDPLRRLHINDYKKEEHSGHVFCPYEHPLIGKQGLKKTWHFAHVTASDCEASRLMGSFHHWWQDRVLDDFLEIRMERDGIRHIADMVNGDDLVIEFQKSVIPQSVIIDRESFYDNMIWVICCSEGHTFKEVKTCGRYKRLRMQSGSKFFLDVRKRMFLDFDLRGVLEVIKILKKDTSKPELIVKVWLQSEFDEQFMRGCLKPNCDTRVHRPPYEVEEKDVKYEDAEKILMSKGK